MMADHLRNFSSSTLHALGKYKKRN